jgi:hypothetical protein
MYGKVSATSLRCAIALVSILSYLAACSRDDRPTALKQCVATVEKEVSRGQIPYIVATQSAEVRHDRIGQEVASCMAEEGYLHDDIAMVDQRCVDDVEFNPYCYRKGK